MDDNHFDVFSDKEKAMHQALWMESYYVTFSMPKSLLKS